MDPDEASTGYEAGAHQSTHRVYEELEKRAVRTLLDKGLAPFTWG